MTLNKASSGQCWENRAGPLQLVEKLISPSSALLLRSMVITGGMIRIVVCVVTGFVPSTPMYLPHHVISYSVLFPSWVLLPIFNAFSSDNGQAHWPSMLWGSCVLCCTVSGVPGNLETLIITPQMWVLRRIWLHLCQGQAAVQVVSLLLAPVPRVSHPHMPQF